MITAYRANADAWQDVQDHLMLKFANGELTPNGIFTSQDCEMFRLGLLAIPHFLEQCIDRKNQQNHQ
jgi:hypothetical protein